MTREEAIKYLRQIYPNGGHCWLDSQRIEAIDMAIMALSKPSLPSNLDEAAEESLEKEQVTGYINNPCAACVNDKGCVTCENYNMREMQPQGLDVTDFCKPIPKEIAKVMSDVVSECLLGYEKEPEVELEKAYKSYMQSRKDDLSGNAVTLNMKDLARHFYELGLKARKEE